MKLLVALFPMLCIQVAMSPFCLCLGANAKGGEATPVCCHDPAGKDPAPCPHCDQELPLSATVPANADCSAKPPEWHGFDPPSVADLFPVRYASVSERFETRKMMRDHDPPPLPVYKRYGVFLI